MQVKGISIHPQYDAKAATYDLALVWMNTPINRSSTVHEVCLPRENKQYAGENVWITGWGKSAEGILIRFLQGFVEYQFDFYQKREISIIENLFFHIFWKIFLSQEYLY